MLDLKNFAVRRLLLLGALFLLGGCQAEIIEDNDYQVEVTPLSTEYLSMIDETTIGRMFGVSPYGWRGSNPTWDPDYPELYEMFYGRIPMASANDVLEATFANLSVETFDYVFMLFLNYEPIDFYVLGEEGWVRNFHFSLEGGYEINIPFRLDLNPSSAHTYKLTAGLFANPNEHAKDENSDFWLLASANVVNLDLIFGNGADINLSQSYNTVPLERSESVGWLPLHFSQDIHSLDTIWETEWDWENLPTIQAIVGEKIEFNFIASVFPEHEAIENYLILALLDWEPVELSGNPFLFVEIEENDDYPEGFISDFGDFTIQVPSEPGYFELVGIIIPNANHANTPSFMSSGPLRTSFRMTVKVTE